MRNTTSIVSFTILLIAASILPNGSLIAQAQHSQKVTNLLDQAKALRFSNPDSAQLLSDISLNIAKRNKLHDAHANAIILNVNLLRDKGDFAKALRLLKTNYDQLSDKLSPKSTTNICYEMGHMHYRLNQLKDAHEWLNRGIVISAANNLQQRLGKLFNLKGNIYFENQTDSAKYYYLKALDAGIIAKDSTRIASSHGNLGRIKNRKEGDHDGALKNYFACLEMFQSIGNLRATALTHSNIANVYVKQKSLDQAITHQAKSLEISERGKDKNAILLAYHSLGNINLELGRYDEAMTYYNKGINLAKSTQSFRELASGYQNKGSAFMDVPNSDSAFIYLNQALELSKEINYGHITAYATYNIGALHQQLGNYSLAEKHLLKAKEIFIEIGEEQNVNWLVPRLAQLYMIWSEKNPDLFTTKVNLDELEYLLIDSYKKNIKIGDLINRDIIFRLLIKIYTEKGNHQQKAFFQQELISLQDSTYQKSKLEVANEWAEKLQTAEKEKEIIQLESKNKISKFKNQILLASLGALIILFGGIFYFWNKFIKQKHERNRVIENELIRTKVSADLHDEVGTMLSSLSLQTEVLGLDAPPEKLEKFNKLANLSREAMGRMRDTVWAIDSRKDSTSDLINRMQDYIADTLQEKNISTNFKFDNLNQDEALPPDIRQNVYLIFKEAINNIIRHSNASKVEIILNYVNQKLHLKISDNGTFDPGKIKSSGTGLSNLKMRAERINGTLEIHKNNGFAVELTV